MPDVSKPKISHEEWEQIKSDAEAAKEILSEPRFKFLRDYLDKAKRSILETFATESINDACVEDKIGETRTRKVYFPAQKEYSHLAGEYKFIERFLVDISSFSDLENSAREQAKKGVLVIEESKEGEK